MPQSRGAASSTRVRQATCAFADAVRAAAEAAGQAHTACSMQQDNEGSSRRYCLAAFLVTSSEPCAVPRAVAVATGVHRQMVLPRILCKYRRKPGSCSTHQLSSHHIGTQAPSSFLHGCCVRTRRMGCACMTAMQKHWPAGRCCAGSTPSSSLLWTARSSRTGWGTRQQLHQEAVQTQRPPRLH